LEVARAVKQPFRLNAAGFATLPQAAVGTRNDGIAVTYHGVGLDPLFIDNPVLLANSAYGKPLAGAQGLFRLVAPKEKRGARSIGMLTKLQAGFLRR
jgi:hypothetical protein